MKPIKKTSVTSKALALATGAGAAALAGEAAHGAVVMGGDLDINPIGIDSGTVSWDIDGNGGDEFEFLANSVSTGILLSPRNGAMLNGSFSALNNLADGYSLGGGMGGSTNTAFFLLSSGGVASSVNQFNAGQPGYIGFKFDIGGDMHFGFAEIVITDTSSFAPSVEVLNVFYEDQANTAITIGPVPEPSSLTLLALGAAGLATWRRRKKSE